MSVEVGSISQFQVEDAVRRLYSHVCRAHWNGQAIVGPDQGIRWHIRFWRFVKSYTPFIPWNERFLFIQAQGDWVQCNWSLFEKYRDEHYKNVALSCTDYLLKIQLDDGSFEYPLRERKHLKATVEGNWGAIAFLESYRRTGAKKFLDAASKWHGFLINKIGFQEYRGTLAINYFNQPRGNVPNNTAEVLWLLAEFYDITGDRNYLQYTDRMIEFLKQVQLPTGELPYVVESPYEGRRDHYLCYQYNAFQFVKLVRYYDLTKNEKIFAVLRLLAEYLSTGISKQGYCKVDCFRSFPQVYYYTAILAQALLKADQIGLGPYDALALGLYRHLLSRQLPNGGFIFSSRDYRVLSDRRSYPRNQVMILDALLALEEQQSGR
ncbi:MAG: hypothetical protein WBK96_01645 [Candidatus Manganitrophaceae bacterium]